MIDREHDLSITQQAEALNISRGSVYYLPRPVSANDLEVMRRLDRLHLQFPFAGSRMLRGLLAAEGCKIGRRHVKTLMRRMGIEALYRRPRTTKPEPGHKIYPYLLRDLEITRPNQVDLKRPLHGISSRLVDLLPVVRNAVYFPDFHFSNSMKSFAPALCVGFSYDNLEGISDGSAASDAYLELASGHVNDQMEIDRLRAALLAYCRRDTLALVEVHHALRRLAFPSTKEA